MRQNDKKGNVVGLFCLVWRRSGGEPFLVRKSPDVSKKFPPLSPHPPLRSDLRGTGRTFFGVGLFAAKEASQRQVYV